jgi:hypothetical protein
VAWERQSNTRISCLVSIQLGIPDKMSDYER